MVHVGPDPGAAERSWLRAGTKWLSAGQAEFLTRGIRFIAVGGAAFLTYLAIMWVLVDQRQNSATVGAAVAFTVATIVSYVGNTLWSFRAPIRGRTAWRFLVIVLLGLAANMAIASALQALGLGYALISVIVFISVPVLNFLGHQFWTFRVDGHGRQSGTPV
jgi:putative flippase GtrA